MTADADFALVPGSCGSRMASANVYFNVGAERLARASGGLLVLGAK